MEDYKISLRHISKSFPGVKALTDINFNVKKGTVHAIMGENGAGKSTMMKIINGIYSADEGEILIDGKKADIRNPQQASEYGIAMIYQELYYIPEFTIEEYLFLGKEPAKIKGIVDWKKLHQDAIKLLEREGAEYDPKTRIKDITVSDLQIIEIIKATNSGAEIIIMDEPTSSISNKEVDRLFEKIRELRSRGITIIYISHKLDEIFQIADHITVIRDGAVIETRKAEDYDNDTIIAKMVGRPLDNIYPEMDTNPGDVCFEVKGLTGEKFSDVSFNVKKGEIVGFAGLVGAGRTEVMRAIIGLDPVKAGEIHKDGRKVKMRNPNEAKNQGVVMVSEDRRRYGIVGVRSIRDNITLPNLKKLSKYGVLSSEREKAVAKEYFKKLNIRAPKDTTLLQKLSGGNQQKVVLAKWLYSDPKVLILDEPTRGIDVGAKYEIYCIIRDLAKQGAAVIVVSSELPEIIGICDRVFVMAEGKMRGEIGRDSMSQEDIMKLATGGLKNG